MIEQQNAQKIQSLQEAFAKAAQRALEKEQKEQQEKVQKVLLELNSKVFEKAQAYVNVITLSGYAGAFAIWSSTKASLTSKTNISVAFLLGVSITIFVFYEIFAMLVRTKGLVRTRKLVAGNMEPPQFFEKLKKAQEDEARESTKYMVPWMVVFVFCIVTAVLAIGLLFYNYFALLVGWSMWPS